MTRFAVELLPEAEAEIGEAFRWYRERSPIAADAFRAEILEAIDGLGESADTWPVDAEGVSRFVLRHFPYTVHYEILDKRAIVLAIAHQRRRPGYWRER